VDLDIKGRLMKKNVMLVCLLMLIGIVSQGCGNNENHHKYHDDDGNSQEQALPKSQPQEPEATPEPTPTETPKTYSKVLTVHASGLDATQFRKYTLVDTESELIITIGESVYTYEKQNLVGYSVEMKEDEN
jgi:hypothetical protein